MTTMFKKLTVVLGIVLIGTILTATADAACGDFKLTNPKASLQNQSWQSEFQPASLLLVQQTNDPIVGMWQVTFTAKGNREGPPNGTVIDSALVVWHNDGTEIMNSGRPAQDGNFCMGVWAKIGLRYKLNHFAIGNDTTNAPSGIGNPTGPTRIAETIYMGAGGDTYTGRFTLDATDTSGNSSAHIIGDVSATRITVDTTSLF
jgi:hypothetical protein